jgi:YHS domain-containing protein
MIRVSNFLLIFFLAAAITYTTFSQNKDENTKKDVNQENNEQVKTEDEKPFNVVCPVSKEVIDDPVTYTYKGVTYAVCCKNCLKKFKKDPEKYISRLSEDGKSIKEKEPEKN